MQRRELGLSEGEVNGESPGIITGKPRRANSISSKILSFTSRRWRAKYGFRFAMAIILTKMGLPSRSTVASERHVDHAVGQVIMFRSHHERSDEQE